MLSIKNFSQGVRRKTQGTKRSLQKLAFESKDQKGRGTGISC